MKEKNSPILSQKKPWASNDNTIWLGSVIKLCRNIEKFNFPGKLGVDRRKQIVALAGNALVGIEGLTNAKLIKGEEMTPLEKEYLVEHYLTSQSFHQAGQGEAFVIDDTGKFMVSVNLRDHLHMYYIDCEGELENTWNRLVKMETTLGKSLTYSFSHKFGFLTADPGQSGTGLTISAFLQVPGLIHSEKIDEVLEKYSEEGMLIAGLQGSPTEIIGDVLAIQNNYTLGITEENIISNLRSFITKMMVEENSARSHIRHTENAVIKDKVSRAYGILIHSYQIEAVEALNAISLLKLGADMGWLSGMHPTEFNELFFNCRRGHLLSGFPETIPQEEILHKRAEFIHKALKNVTLNI